MLDRRTSYGAGLALPECNHADLALFTLVVARCQWLHLVTRCKRCFVVESCARVVQRADAESAECNGDAPRQSKLGGETDLRLYKRSLQPLICLPADHTVF
jgi:hypothetical protein